jgi:hypothetical protein
MTVRRSVIKTVAVVAAAGSVAGVAVAATSGSEPAVPPERSATVVTAVDADQAALLGALRRPATAADDLSAGARDTVARGSGPALGANPELGRLGLTTPLGEHLYLVPAQGWVCLVSSTSSESCTPTDQLAAGYAVGLRVIPSGYRLAGMVPDGVDQVDVRGSSTSVTVTVGENAWEADVAFAPTSVAWTGPAGEQVVPVAPPTSDDGPLAGG